MCIKDRQKQLDHRKAEATREKENTTTEEKWKKKECDDQESGLFRLIQEKLTKLFTERAN